MKMPERALEALEKYRKANFDLMKRLAEVDHPFDDDNHHRKIIPLTKHG